MEPNNICYSFLGLKKIITVSPNNPDLIQIIMSPNSPFYDPLETPSQHITKALHSSINRVNHFKPTSSLSTNAAQANIISNGGEYLLEYSVGTPPVQILGIDDIGSELIWLQCKPCNGFYKQTTPLEVQN